MKLHKMERTTADHFGVNSVAALADKYLARYSNQLAFSRGKYPPSRDTDFRIQIEQDQFNDELAKGGHGVPISSAYRLPDGVERGLLTVRVQTLPTLSTTTRLLSAPRRRHSRCALSVQVVRWLSPLIPLLSAQVIPDSGSSNLWGAFCRVVASLE